jgi:formate/nitrite transporter FocA (FNT family)
MASKDVSVDTSRLTAPQIFHAAQESARKELRRSSTKLMFSGIAGGLVMGLTGLSVAAVRAVLGPGQWQEFVSFLVYPTGFIAVIIGRAQLFTENTLYPVLLVLDEEKNRARYLTETLRLWGVVFASNVAGAFLFSVLAMKTGALPPNISAQLADLGRLAVTGTASHYFWSGIIGGWLIALVAWVVTASHWTIGQVMMIWLLTFVVGIGHFSHCIASSGEILSTVVDGGLSTGTYLHWLLFATAGNIVGGVIMVSMLNYGQVKLD